VTRAHTTLCTPEQNGMIERFFRSLKEKCIWLHPFTSRDHAFSVVAEGIEFYDTERVHAARGQMRRESRERRKHLTALQAKISIVNILKICRKVHRTHLLSYSSSPIQRSSQQKEFFR
jgi:transposase InsO family protein